MNLNRTNLNKIRLQSGVTTPGDSVFSLPEKVLQFGTGVLLRGLPDYFIDKANRMGIFNGRIVVIKSTSSGGTDEFAKQDGLFTLCVNGIESGETVEERIINSSISRVLTAKDQWEQVLACARNENIQLVISNTTEVGITYVEEKIRSNEAPVSFPAKLLAVLHERFLHFKGNKENGMVIIPTELIIGNGAKLRSIVLQLAEYNKFSREFTDWLVFSNDFCDSLVDRIVPGKLPDTQKIKVEQQLGYKDDLMIMAESFRLWAIQSSSPRVKKLLSFSQADHGVVIADDIEKFRELKLRLLNGTHTFTCGLAFLAGFSTVREAMSDNLVAGYVRKLMHDEIVPAIADVNISEQDARDFADKVVDRFCNPHLDHKWSGIAVQFTSKMKMRNVPLIFSYYTRTGNLPPLMSLGFAAYLIYMRCHLTGNNYVGHANGSDYLLSDDNAAFFAEVWKDNDIERVVEMVTNEDKIWDVQLSSITGFQNDIRNNIRQILMHGVMNTLTQLQTEKAN